MKRIFLLLITASIVSGCSLIDAFVKDQPPALIDYGYPELVDVPSERFKMHEDGERLVVQYSVIEDLGRNTASCLNQIELYSMQVSTYNEHYGKE